MASGFDRDRLRDVRARVALDRPITEWGDMIPLIHDIGERLINATRERFSHGRALDSAPGRRRSPRRRGGTRPATPAGCSPGQRLSATALLGAGGERPGRARAEARQAP